MPSTYVHSKYKFLNKFIYIHCIWNITGTRTSLHDTLRRSRRTVPISMCTKVCAATLVALMLVDTAKAAVAFAWFKGEKSESCNDACARLGQGACNATGFQYAGTQAALESIKGDFFCVSKRRRIKINKVRCAISPYVSIFTTHNCNNWSLRLLKQWWL